MPNKLDIKEIFDQNHIHYVEYGSNVARGNINVKCPFCSDDPSEHMGVSLDPPYVYGCWRNSDHRGKNIAFLFSHLFNISYSRAKELVGDNARIDLDNFFDDISNIFNVQENTMEVGEVILPEGFRHLYDYRNSVSAKPYINYLKNRGFPEVEDMAVMYDLGYAISGEYAHRIILPIYNEDMELLSWTGRSIQENPHLRYKSASYKKGEGYNLKDYVFHPPNIEETDRVLVVTEGPFDALKVDWISLSQTNSGVRATSIFGASHTESQLADLSLLSNQFDKVVIMLDNDDAGQIEAQKLFGDLLTKAKVVNYQGLPKGSDPGSLSIKDTIKLVESFV